MNATVSIGCPTLGPDRCSFTCANGTVVSLTREEVRENHDRIRFASLSGEQRAVFDGYDAPTGVEVTATTHRFWVFLFPDVLNGVTDWAYDA